MASGQKFVDVSSAMMMPSGSYVVDTTGFSSIDAMTPNEVAERSWATLGFHAAIPFKDDPAPALSTYESELSRDSMVSRDAAGLFLYDTMYSRFGNYVWVFQDRDNSAGYATYNVRFASLVRCRDYDAFFYSMKYGMMGSSEYLSFPVGVASNDAYVVGPTLIEVHRRDVLAFRSNKELHGTVQLCTVHGAVERPLHITSVEGRGYVSTETVDCANGLYYLTSDQGFIAFVSVTD